MENKKCMIKVTQEKGQVPQAFSDRKAKIMSFKAEIPKKGVKKWDYVAEICNLFTRKSKLYY